MHNKNLQESEALSLIHDIASFSSHVVFLTIMGYAGERGGVDGGSSVEETTEKIRAHADEITEAIKDMFGSSADKTIRMSTEAACNAIWDIAGMSSAFLEMQEEDEEDDDE